jgi:hypothetical protein
MELARGANNPPKNVVTPSLLKKFRRFIALVCPDKDKNSGLPATGEACKSHHNRFGFFPHLRTFTVSTQ